MAERYGPRFDSRQERAPWRRPRQMFEQLRRRAQTRLLRRDRRVPAEDSACRSGLRQVADHHQSLKMGTLPVDGPWLSKRSLQVGAVIPINEFRARLRHAIASLFLMISWDLQ